MERPRIEDFQGRVGEGFTSRHLTDDVGEEWLLHEVSPLPAPEREELRGLVCFSLVFLRPVNGPAPQGTYQIRSLDGGYEGTLFACPGMGREMLVTVN